MLKQRVITAVLLLLVLVPAMLHPAPQAFMALTLLMIGAAAWEWGRLNGAGQVGSWCCGAACALLCALGWWFGWVVQPVGPVWIIASALWVLAGAVLLAGGSAAWSQRPRALRLPAGVLVLALAWLALAQARALGVNFLLSALLLVWVADVFAYFVGRAYGHNKLAPSVSPGKSWEGVWGGLAGVALLALAWVLADWQWPSNSPSLFTRLLGLGLLVLLTGVVYLVAMSVLGDLLESLVKRSAGVKDSSALLPGHGGVLDRIDALLPVLPAAMMLASFGTGP
jgi:phosphatidate cytidylyltransferase